MHKIRVPATSANLGPGFDSLGIAFNLYNTFTFEEIPKGLEIVGCDEYYNNEDNLIYLSMKKALADMDHRISGVRITVDSDIPISSGLGSSAACIVAGILGANELAGRPFSKDDMLRTATNIEGHPDNVAPAIFGGLVVSIMEEDEVIHNSIEVARGLKFVALIPDLKISTKKARAALPKTISLSDGIFNVSRVSLLISALSNGKFELLKYGLEDKFHQPYRSKLIPDFDEIMAICQEHKAIGTFLSGAGPTILALIDEDNNNFVQGITKDLKPLKNTWTVKELELDLEGASVLAF
jgi:homoserine kinase